MPSFQLLPCLVKIASIIWFGKGFATHIFQGWGLWTGGFGRGWTNKTQWGVGLRSFKWIAKLLKVFIMPHLFHCDQVGNFQCCPCSLYCFRYCLFCQLNFIWKWSECKRTGNVHLMLGYLLYWYLDFKNTLLYRIYYQK